MILKWNDRNIQILNFYKFGNFEVFFYILKSKILIRYKELKFELLRCSIKMLIKIIRILFYFVEKSLKPGWSKYDRYFSEQCH